MITVKKLRVVTVAAAMAAVTLFATPSPAQANEISYCGHSYVWFWGAANYYRDDQRIDFDQQYWYNGRHYHITRHWEWHFVYRHGTLWENTHDRHHACWWH